MKSHPFSKRQFYTTFKTPLTQNHQVVGQADEFGLHVLHFVRVDPGFGLSELVFEGVVSLFNVPASNPGRIVISVVTNS